MAVYKNMIVPVPESGVILHKIGKSKSVSVEYVTEAPYDADKQYTKPKRIVVGHLIDHDRTKMHPTTNYKKVYSDLWEKYSGETVVPDSLKVGLFSFAQALDSKTELLEMLDKAFGYDKAAPMMDYALYSLLNHSDISSAFSSRMKDELLYSHKALSDSSYSRLFEEKMEEGQILQFQKEWACYCKKQGVEEVWLYLDGSNIDCKAQGVEFGEKGKAKSGKNVDIVSFSCAVAPDGMPVAFQVYRGSQVDAKALQEIIDFLKECGIKVAGVILDRGYCSASCLQYLQENGIDYIIMCKSNPKSYKKMAAEYGNEIKDNILYWVWFTHLFATQQPVQVFDTLEKEDTLTLFYDPINASQRLETMLDGLSIELQQILAQILSGKKAVVSAEYKDWIEIVKDEQGKEKPALNYEKIQSAIDGKGLYGIISSQKMDPYLIHRLYQSRSVAEVFFRDMKSQLGFHTARAHFTNGVRSKFCVGFLASILRWYVEEAAKKSGYKKGANAMINELDKIKATRINETYVYSHTVQGKMVKFFSQFEADADKVINESVKIKNDRLSGRVWRPRKRKTGPKKGSHHRQYDEEGNLIKKKRGPKPGFKMGPVNKDGTPRKKPGPKPGTKRGKYNKDGSLRQKPGPKPKSATSQ